MNLQELLLTATGGETTTDNTNQVLAVDEDGNQYQVSSVSQDNEIESGTTTIWLDLTRI